MDFSAELFFSHIAGAALSQRHGYVSVPSVTSGTFRGKPPVLVCPLLLSQNIPDWITYEQLK